MARSISRDPFARGNVIRSNVYVGMGAKGDPSKGCAFCGGLKETPRGIPFLYRYGWDDDQGRRQSSEDRELFCSIGCRRAYRGE